MRKTPRRDLAPDLRKVAVQSYIDPQCWAHEDEARYKHSPIAAEFSSELEKPGSCKALSLVGVPVL